MQSQNIFCVYYLRYKTLWWDHCSFIIFFTIWYCIQWRHTISTVSYVATRALDRCGDLWWSMGQSGMIYRECKEMPIKHHVPNFSVQSRKAVTVLFIVRGGIILHTSMTFDKYSWNISGCGAIQIRIAMVKVAILEIGCHVVFLTVNW